MSLFKSRSTVSQVGGMDIAFFPLSIPTLFALKSVIGPIANLVSTFFKGSRTDVARYQEDSMDPQGKPIRIQQSQPITEPIAKLRAAQNTAVTKELVEALFADQNRLLLGRILMDSMREACPRRPSAEQINLFLEDLDLGILVEMLQGVGRANAEVFGPLAQRLTQAVKLEVNDRLRGQGSSESPNSGLTEPNAPLPGPGNQQQPQPVQTE